MTSENTSNVNPAAVRQGKGSKLKAPTAVGTSAPLWSYSLPGEEATHQECLTLAVGQYAKGLAAKSVHLVAACECYHEWLTRRTAAYPGETRVQQWGLFSGQVALECGYTPDQTQFTKAWGAVSVLYPEGAAGFLRDVAAGNVRAVAYRSLRFRSSMLEDNSQGKGLSYTLADNVDGVKARELFTRLCREAIPEDEVKRLVKEATATATATATEDKPATATEDKPAEPTAVGTEDKPAEPTAVGTEDKPATAENAPLITEDKPAAPAKDDKEPRHPAEQMMALAAKTDDYLDVYSSLGAILSRDDTGIAALEAIVYGAAEGGKAELALSTIRNLANALLGKLARNAA